MMQIIHMNYARSWVRVGAGASLLMVQFACSGPSGSADRSERTARQATPILGGAQSIRLGNVMNSRGE
jgi:hypothetical protein